MQKGKKFKAKLRTMIVCSGVTYGFEENILAFLFKRAWSNDHYLPIFGSGSNFVPLIHVADLSQVICKLIDMAPLKKQYILAVEQTPTCLKYVVKYISRALGQGKIEYVVPEEAYLYSEIDHFIFDCLTTNILMEPEFVLKPLGIVWRSEMNFVENIERIAEEFKIHRNLEPLKIYIHGPPCTGKTKLAHLLCNYYNLHYISIKSILDPSELKLVSLPLHSTHSTCKSRSKTQLTKESNKLNITNQDMEELIDSEDADDILNLDVHDSEEESYQKTVADEQKKYMPRDLTENSRIPDDQVVVLLRREMLKNHAQNLGFVLDGYPKTFRQASWLFRNENYIYSMNFDEISGFATKYDRRLITDYVIDLDASDSFLLDRMSRHPEESIQNTHYNERGMIRRLMAYREHNLVSGPMNYFHDCETQIVEMDVSEFPSEDFRCIFHICKKIIGAPRGFGPTQKEIDEIEIVYDYQNKFQHEKEELQKQLQMKEEKQDLDEKMMKLLEKYHHNNVRLERILGPKIEKYRMFIARNVLPVLFQALMIVAEKKPRNPLDFLAEHLFKKNPNGRMYNCRYSRNGEDLIDNNIQ